MSENLIRKNKHLTFDDRLTIQEGLTKNLTFNDSGEVTVGTGDSGDVRLSNKSYFWPPFCNDISSFSYIF